MLEGSLLSFALSLVLAKVKSCLKFEKKSQSGKR